MHAMRQPLVLWTSMDRVDHLLPGDAHPRLLLSSINKKKQEKFRKSSDETMDYSSIEKIEQVDLFCPMTSCSIEQMCTRF